MTVATSHHYRTSAGYQNPVDDQTYDLLQVLVSKCEALEAYAKYEQDADDETRRIFEKLGADDAEHARQLMDALRGRLNQG